MLLHAKFVEFAVEIALADPENPCGIAAMSSAGLQHATDVAALEFIKARETIAIGSGYRGGGPHAWR